METRYPIYESVDILVNNEDKINYGEKCKEVRTILENSSSPVTRKYHEKLFQSVISKSHIDFGNIGTSNGNIKNYPGYNNMIEILDVINKLALEEKNNDVLKYTKIVNDSIKNIENLSSSYEKGFTTKTGYVMLEYNTYVYTCVEATTTLLYEFVEYVKRPDMVTFKISLKNNKNRANVFYFDQLSKFNNVNDKMGIEYRNMLESMCNKGKNNFIGVDTMVGVAAISMAALAIVPITRELVYQFYKLKGHLSSSLEMQASFLEMNKTCLEANSSITLDKKKKILQRQEKLRNKLLKLSGVLKVKSVKSLSDSKRELDKSNKMLSIDSLRDEVSDSPLELI